MGVAGRFGFVGFVVATLGFCRCMQAAGAAPQAPLSVWFMPAGNSPDIDNLFTQPEDWAETRKHVETFVFSPGQLLPGGEGHPSLLAGLVAADAFRTLQTWGLRTAIEVPALKEWDCSGRQTVAVTAGLMKTIIEGGGAVRFLVMDEPLISAFGLNTPTCHLDMDAAAGVVTDYARSLTTHPNSPFAGDAPAIIDTEAYPALSVAQIEAWLLALQRHGFKPAAFHLDADLHNIEGNVAAKARLAGDLQELKKFLSTLGISFGVIIWSGYDPIRSDAEYYARSMSWAHVIHDAIGRPDRVIFESWVKRCSLSNPCSGSKLGCSAADPVYCGTTSVLLNLPENGSGAFSHTKLINDARTVLMAP